MTGRERDAVPPLQVVVLPARTGALPSVRPPVRIFLGTEPAQYRAERVFLWSIEQVRDPGRTYEIHLMRGLPGFRKTLSTTGFTNFRFAVPSLAGASGRAIYNDVDQVYLSDPAELFDLPLGEHGYLAVSETDTSVMVVDCARMAPFWTLDRAQRRRKYRLVEAARSAFGALPGEWNARDEEYIPGKSKLLHYTTIHKQPWRPFPERFLYQPNAAGDVWLSMERDADEAGHQIFTTDAPSAAFLERRREPARLGATSAGVLDEAVRRIVERTASRSVLALTPGDGVLEPASAGAWSSGPSAPEVERQGFFAPRAGRVAWDGVVSGVRLDELPPEDLPHVVEQLFARADRFVFAAVRCPPPARRRLLHPPQGTVGQPVFWDWLFRSAARRHPGVFWQVAYVRTSGREGAALRAFADGSTEPAVEFLQGGPFPETLSQNAKSDVRPRVWVLADHKPGHTTQSQGLAAELGWPYECIHLEFNLGAELPNAWTRGTRRSLKPASAARLEAPWPDLVIATGRRTAPIASWIRKQSRGATRTVQMGRIGAFEKDEFDLGVSPAYACLYPDARRIDTAAPVTRVSPSALRAAETRWGPELASAPAPRIALLVGGRDPEHSFTPEQARRMGAAVRELAKREGGCVLTTTSRRTSPRSAAALAESLGDACVYSHQWSEGAPPDENPYMGYLALADAIVVTGESASMLAEACATGKPVYIYPLAHRAQGPKTWALRAERLLADAVTARAYARPVNRRGIERPQRGLELLCANLLARGFVRTSGHSERLHRELVERGLAKLFDGKLAPIPSDHLTDVERVADRVRLLMGVASAAPPPEPL